MRKHTKLLVAGITAALLMGLGVASASARSFSTTESAFRVTWRSLEFTASIFEIRCPVTLEGSFHGSTITKAPKGLIGYITRAVVNNTACTGGRATVLTETLPWHIRYDSFAGTLPNITSIRVLLSNASFQIAARTIFGDITCLARSEPSRPAEGRITRNVTTGQVTGLVAEPVPPIPIVSGSGFCPEEGTFSGTGTVTRLGGTTPITVTLI